jgi:membrane protein
MKDLSWQPRDWMKRSADFIRRVLRGLLEHSALDHAATMSFYFFLGLIPLLVFAGHLLASTIDSFDELTRRLLQFAPSSVVELITGQLRAMADGPSRSVAPLSLLGFLILTSNGVHNLMDVLELVTRAPHRPWWKQRLIAVLSIIGMLEAGVGVSYLLLKLKGVFQVRYHDDPQGFTFVIDALRNFAASTWQQLGAFSLFGGLLAIGLAVFYRYGVSYPTRVKRRVWPGTFVAIGGWMLFSWAFSTYVKSIGQYAVYYGSLATVAVLMVWLYLTSLSILLGAEVNAQLEGLRDPYNSRIRPKKPLAGYIRPGARADASQTPLPTPLPDSSPAPESFSTPPPAPAAPALREVRDS